MNRSQKLSWVFGLLVVVGSFIPFHPRVLAANGTIDPNNENKQFAIIEEDGTSINFGCTNCDITVTDSAVTGDAWSEDYGWLNMQPTNGGVTNDGNGNLSGEAWGENLGWVNFDLANGGVSIEDGVFTGAAWSENAGWIIFDCADADSCVSTDWSPDGPGDTDDDDGPSGPDPACDDGLDNDGDGFIDHPADLGCTNQNDPSELLAGCTDQAAINYNGQAGVDDGSCVLAGCTDSFADNYDPAAQVPDQSCRYTLPDDPEGVFGCTDQAAANFNPAASVPNGSCVYPPPPIVGCMDDEASNYNSAATISNASCVFPPLPEVPEWLDDAGDFVSGAGADIRDAARDPRTLSLLALLLPLFIHFVADPNKTVSLVVIPARIWSLIPVWFGLRKRKRPWGTVYDSVTKQPLDPAYVELQSGRTTVATSITDIDGRYGFLTEPGEYTLRVRKDDYVFPSERLAGSSSDAIYEHLYHGEKLEVGKTGELIARNIPLDPKSFNWNEYAKAGNQKLMRFYRRRNVALAYVSRTAFYVGGVIAATSFAAAITTANSIILSIYVILTGLQFMGVYPKSPGYVMKKDSGAALPFAVIRIFSATFKQEMKTVVANQYGKYYALLPRGNYFITIEEKTGLDSYKKIFTSSSFTVRNGFLAKNWKV